jgi:hypothetical protein
MCIKYIPCIFSTTIGFHVCGSWHITKKKKQKAMSICKISFSFLRQSFSPRKKVYFAFIVQKCKQITFLNGFSTNSFKFLNGPIFNAFIWRSFTTKIHPKIPLIPLLFKYICKFSNFVTSIILSQIYSICSNFWIFFEYLWILE